MKYIFLSTDGVLSNQQYLGMICGRANSALNKDPGGDLSQKEWIYKHKNQVDKSKVQILNYLINKTKADVVLMGQWRMYHSLNDLNGILRRNGANFEAVDMLPVLYKVDSNFRVANHVDELDRWINPNGRSQRSLDPKSFVILDDRSDWGQYQNNLVKVNYDRGLRHFDVEKCLDKLDISYKRL